MHCCCRSKNSSNYSKEMDTKPPLKNEEILAGIPPSLDETSLETYLDDFQIDLNHSEFRNIELIIKLRETAEDLETIWKRCRIARIGTTSVKTGAALISVAGGMCLLAGAGPIGPLIALGGGGILTGTLANIAAVKLEEYLNTKKFSELTELMETSQQLMFQIQEKTKQILSLDCQTLDALLQTSDRVLNPDHSLYPLVQQIKILIRKNLIEGSMAEASSVFGMVRNADNLLTQISSVAVPVELNNLRNQPDEQNQKLSGYQRAGGVLIIISGILTVLTSGQELLELIKNNKFEAADLLRSKADTIESNLRPFDYLRD